MVSTQNKWPGISVTASDRELITRIREYNGILKMIDMKDLLLIAASLAMKRQAPTVSSNEPMSSQITNPALINKPEYSDYRQYIALIFYYTAGNKDLSNMANTSLMVKNFVDYAQRGLRLLEINYLNEKRGSDNLMDELVQLLP
jgi:hypothetical protein